MKSRYKTIIFIAILIVLVTIIVGFKEFCMYRLFGPRLQKIYPDKSESHYAVLFNQSAMQGYTLYFGVIDESKSEPNLIILGPLDYADIPLQIQRVVVSSDGSVVATESIFSIKQGHTPYWLAYDFKNSNCYGEAWSHISRDPNLIDARSRIIQELLQSRGGIGKQFSADDILNKENKLSYLAWKRWQRHVDKAKENCQPWVGN